VLPWGVARGPYVHLAPPRQPSHVDHEAASACDHVAQEVTVMVGSWSGVGFWGMLMSA